MGAGRGEDVSLQKDFLTALPARLTIPHLRSVVRAWEEWRGHVGRHRGSLFEPSAMQVGVFLRQSATRGPTVAPARLRAFRWLREHVGIPFPVASSLLRGFSHAPVGHIPKRPRAFSPDEFWSIIGLFLRGGRGS